MLLQIIKQVARLQIRLIIIINLLLLISVSSFSQKAQPDTVAFKKEFEKLLEKYGLSNKSYMINVNSNNQKGGQTAFIINNNFYGDTATEKNNLTYGFDTVDNHVTLIVSPLKGPWINPFVFADSSDSHNYYEVGAGFVSFARPHFVWVVDKWRSVAGPITHQSVSNNWPLFIKLKDNDPNQYFIFGDFLDPNKTFLFYKGKIQYWGTFTEEQIKRLPPQPTVAEIKTEKQN